MNGQSVFGVIETTESVQDFTFSLNLACLADDRPAGHILERSFHHALQVAGLGGDT